MPANGVATVVFHLDDMYDGWDTEFDELASRVVGQILEPLSRLESGRWQRYDWGAGRFDGWETLVPPEVLILEGCGAGASPSQRIRERAGVGRGRSGGARRPRRGPRRRAGAAEVAGLDGPRGGTLRGPRDTHRADVSLQT